MKEYVKLSKLPQSVRYICGTLVEAFAAGWPLTIPSFMYLLINATNARLTVWSFVLESGVRFRYGTYRMAAGLGFILEYLKPARRALGSIHIMSPEEESRYWNASTRYTKFFDASNANQTSPNIPLVKYYVPKMLPRYRETREHDIEAAEYPLPAAVFCKWHRMVFPGPMHPTPKQAEGLIQNYSNRDKREMRRITRLLTDEEVFAGTVPWTPRYRNMWRVWLETKGPDVAIIFK